MKLVVLALALSFGCAKPKPTPTPYAFPKIDGKQYMTLQVSPDERLVLAIDAVWSCQAGTCTIVPPDTIGTRPTPGNCPCTLQACAKYCDPDLLRQLPPPQQVPSTQTP